MIIFQDPTVQMLLGILGLVYFFISFFSIPVGLVIMVIAMIFSPEIPLGAIGARDIVVRIEDLLIPLLTLAWLAHTVVNRKGTGFVKSPLNLPILLLVGLSLFSTVFGAIRGWLNPVQALFYLGKTIEYFMIFFIVINSVRSERGVRIFLFFMLLTLTGLILYTTWQIPSTAMFSTHRLTAPFEGGRPQPATVGGYIAFFSVIILSLLIYIKKPLLQWLLSALALLSVVSLLYTFNRSSYIAFLGGVLLLAILSKKRWLNVLFAAFLILSPFVLPRAVKERIAYTWEDAKNPYRVLGVDASLQERIFSFRRAWDSLKTSPFFGKGITSYNYVDNQYTRSLCEIGLIGLALWLWIYFRLFKISRWLHHVLEDEIFKGLALGYSAGILCLLLHGFGSITFYVVRIMEPFWFISGLVVSLYLMTLRSYSAVESESKP